MKTFRWKIKVLHDFSWGKNWRSRSWDKWQIENQENLISNFENALTNFDKNLTSNFTLKINMADSEVSGDLPIHIKINKKCIQYAPTKNCILYRTTKKLSNCDKVSTNLFRVGKIICLSNFLVCVLLRPNDESWRQSKPNGSQLI